MFDAGGLSGFGDGLGGGPGEPGGRDDERGEIGPRKRRLTRAIFESLRAFGYLGLTWSPDPRQEGPLSVFPLPRDAGVYEYHALLPASQEYFIIARSDGKSTVYSSEVYYRRFPDLAD